MKILYEDNHVLVAVKPPGVLSQADVTGARDMLSALKEYIKEKANKPGNVYLGLVHRLDRNVGGVMVFAKTSKAAERLSEQVRKHEFSKNYIAVVSGITPRSEKLINIMRKRDSDRTAEVFDQDSVVEGGQRAELDFERIGSMKEQSLLQVNLQTGRFHQIRAQLAHIGFPIFGDVKYGARTENDLGLWAWKLEFMHPTLKEKMTFTAVPDLKKEPWATFSATISQLT